jgi:hypothetical protein
MQRLVRQPLSMTVPTRWSKIQMPIRTEHKQVVLDHIRCVVDPLMCDRMEVEHELCAMESHLMLPGEKPLTPMKFSEEIYKDLIFPCRDYPPQRFVPLVDALKNETHRIEFVDKKNNSFYVRNAAQFPLHMVHAALNRYMHKNTTLCTERTFSAVLADIEEGNVYQQLIDDVEKLATRYYGQLSCAAWKRLSEKAIIEDCLAASASYQNKQREYYSLQGMIEIEEMRIKKFVEAGVRNPEDI